MSPITLQSHTPRPPPWGEVPKPMVPSYGNPRDHLSRAVYPSSLEIRGESIAWASLHIPPACPFETSGRRNRCFCLRKACYTRLQTDVHWVQPTGVFCLAWKVFKYLNSLPTFVNNLKMGAYRASDGSPLWWTWAPFHHSVHSLAPSGIWM